MQFVDPCDAGEIVPIFPEELEVEYYIWTKVQSTADNAPKV